MSQPEAKFRVSKLPLSQSVPLHSALFSFESEEIRLVTEEEEIDEPAIIIDDINSLWPASSSDLIISKSPRSPGGGPEVTFDQCYSLSERHSCIGQAFQKFLKKRQNEESLHFLQNVMAFEKSFSDASASATAEQQTDQETEIDRNICEEAKRITSLFIEPQSTHELNLSCEAKQSFLEQFSKRMAEQSITGTIFKTLKEIVLVQLKEESFEPFLKSEECKDALETLKFINQQLMDSYRSNRKSLTHWFGEADALSKATKDNSKQILNMKDPNLSPRKITATLSPRRTPRGTLKVNPLFVPKDDITSKSADSFFVNQPPNTTPPARKLERRTSFFGKIFGKNRNK